MVDLPESTCLCSCVSVYPAVVMIVVLIEYEPDDDDLSCMLAKLCESWKGRDHRRDNLR